MKLFSVEAAITGGFILFFLILGIVWVKAAQLDSFCAAHGYPNSTLTWTFDEYCVKRQDQTDIVVPISEVK